VLEARPKSYIENFKRNVLEYNEPFESEKTIMCDMWKDYAEMYFDGVVPKCAEKSMHRACCDVNKVLDERFVDAAVDEGVGEGAEGDMLEEAEGDESSQKSNQESSPKKLPAAMTNKRAHEEEDNEEGAENDGSKKRFTCQRSPKKKKVRRSNVIKHVNLLEMSKLELTDANPPSESLIQGAGCDPPGRKWEEAATRLLCVMTHLLSQIKEAVFRGEISVEWDALNKEDKHEIEFIEENNVKSKTWEIQLLIDAEKPLTHARMCKLEDKYKLTEEVYITPFVCKAVALLGMMDVRKFIDQEGTLHEEVVEAKEVFSSLASWAIDYSDRWNLYRFLRVVESLKKKKDLPSLRSLIRSKFATPEKEELMSIVSCVTKRGT